MAVFFATFSCFVVTPWVMGVGGNPESFKSLNPRQKHAGVMGWELSYKGGNPV